MNYERMIKTMQSFLDQRYKDRVSTLNGDLPYKQQRKMDSIIKQAIKIGDSEREEAYNDLLGVHDVLCERLALHRESGRQQSLDIEALERRLVIDTLNPNRRSHICTLEARIEWLEWEVANETYQHWMTMDSEGLEWHGGIVGNPGEPDDYAVALEKHREADRLELAEFRREKQERKELDDFSRARSLL